ncbi:hypothetical protein R4T50_33855 [Bradyrhizobium sp. NL2]|uniref:hypothetical protein n=1 Tax=Bradyrhizobium sp. NL2 TaxID=3082951 RepID=UPI00315D4876
MPSVAVGVADLHVAGLRHGGRDEGNGALADVEDRRILLAAVLIDVIVDGDLRAGGEVERGGVVEGDAERGVRRGPHDVIEIDVVAHAQRIRVLVADHGCDPRHGRDVADRLDGGGLRVRGGRR